MRNKKVLYAGGGRQTCFGREKVWIDELPSTDCSEMDPSCQVRPRDLTSKILLFKDTSLRMMQAPWKYWQWQ